MAASQIGEEEAGPLEHAHQQGDAPGVVGGQLRAELLYALLEAICGHHQPTNRRVRG